MAANNTPLFYNLDAFMYMYIKDIPQNATNDNSSHDENAFMNWCIYTTHNDGTSILTFKLWFIQREYSCKFDTNGNWDKSYINSKDDYYNLCNTNSLLCKVIGRLCIKTTYDKNKNLGRTLNMMISKYIDSSGVLDMYKFLYCIFSYTYPNSKFIVKLRKGILDYDKAYPQPLEKCHLGIVTDINAGYISVKSSTSGILFNSVKKIKSDNLQMIQIPTNDRESDMWTQLYDEKQGCGEPQPASVNRPNLPQMHLPGPPANSPVLQPGSQMHPPGPSNRSGSHMYQQRPANVLEPGSEPGSINGGKRYSRHKKSRRSHRVKKSHRNTKRHRK